MITDQEVHELLTTSAFLRQTYQTFAGSSKEKPGSLIISKRTLSERVSWIKEAIHDHEKRTCLLFLPWL